MKQPLIYIAGKVTGLSTDEAEFKFGLAHSELKTFGFDAINPVDLVKEYLFENPKKANLPPNELWQLAMKLCIANLVECDAVLLLNDWTQSKGAIIESELAEKLGIPRFTTTDEIRKHYEAKRTADHLHN